MRAEDAQEQARAAFERGVAASRAQRWEQAHDEFERSLALVPKPSTQFNLAVADIKLGLGREALAALDGFERSASPAEHAVMLERAPVLRKQAQALVQSEEAKAMHGGNALGEYVEGLSEQARQDLAAGREHYARGRDREALTAFERAYRESQRPELLYDIGVVADRLREDERAVRAYDAFLSAIPDAPEAAVAQRRVEALRPTLSARASAVRVSSAVAPERTDATPSLGSSHAPDLRAARTLLVAGPVVVAASIGTLFWFLDRSDKYDQCASSDRCVNADTLRGERRAALATTVLLAATGLALTSAGATLAALRKRASRETALSLDGALALDRYPGGYLTLIGHF